ncbi:replicative DNA helicase [Micromonospora sp. M42]|nr:predicted protein [Streptomyces sp. SPB78]EWM62831.1 replicative DNA helicase [Micromonospora sp. M42]
MAAGHPDPSQYGDDVTVEALCKTHSEGCEMLTKAMRALVDDAFVENRPWPLTSESPRSREADLIVAKHRNGPTATITVAFLGHYSQFADMSQT